MTGKEKLALALKHEEGPLLLDIGSMPTTGIHCSVLAQLRDYLGLEKHPIRIIEPMQFLGLVENDVKEALGIQTAPLWDVRSLFGFRQAGEYKQWRTPWGQEVLVSTEFEYSNDVNGDVLLYAQADKNFLPAARMPVTSYYFDAIERVPEFDEDNYDVKDNLEEFQPIAQENLDWFAKNAALLKDSDDVIAGNLGGTGIGDVALITGPMLKQPKGLRNITEWYVSTLVRQDILHEIFAYQTELAIKNLEKMHDALQETIQVAYICGTDFGTQNAPFCSKDTFDSLYAPYYKKINGWIHEHTTWKSFKHSCGSIFSLIPELIDAGFDVLNPVQWTAMNMNKQELKDRYGKDVVFWGGGINTQQTLPFGTPQQVFDEALEVCKIFGKNGGFVFNTIHNIQPGVSPENVVALANAVKHYNDER